jgi:DNA end-binding protein Ku
MERRRRLPKGKPKRQRTDSNDRQEASVRPFWSGTISFGLVSIPVNLYPGNRDSRVPLRMLGPKGDALKREYVGAQTGNELDESATTRGFEIGKGKYVTVSEEELERLAPEKSRDIDLRLFVAQEEVSPIYFERSYFLTPADKSGKAYRLLAETMERKERVGIASFVMHGKEYLIAIFAENGILGAETLRFADEIRTPSDIGLPKRTKVHAASVRKFETAITKGTKKNIDTRQMRDEYAESMMKLIEKKRARHKDVVEAESETRGPAKVIDLMEVLKQSLGQGRKSRRAA